jgi:hypothetical protein
MNLMTKLLFFAGESSESFEACPACPRGLCLVAQELGNRDVHGFCGALNEVEQGVAAASFVVVD